MKTIMVRILDDYVINKNLPVDIGLVLRGPYENVIKMTKDYSTCEIMYDLLVAGKIYKKIPCQYCTKIKS
jgi:hypothetical protein